MIARAARCTKAPRASRPRKGKLTIFATPLRLLRRWLPLLSSRRAALLSAALAATAAVAAPSPAHAYDIDSQAWGLFTFNARYPSGLRLYAEVQPRQGDDYSRFSQLLVRPAVGYHVTPKISAWLGYGWTPSFLPEYNNENRVFQQVLHEDSFRGMGLTNRFRLEERWIEGAGGTSVRVRHQTRISKPLGRERRWAAIAYDELFWNLNSTLRGPQAGYDQNRVYVGAGYNTDRHTRVELGYLASFINPPRGRPDRRLDVLVLTVNYNL